MEQLAHCFFEEVLSGSDRSSLHDRMKRRQLCEYLYWMVKNCSTFEDDEESNCDKAVRAALGFHRRTKEQNGGVCLMGKYHNTLYIAARLAFLFRLSTASVTELLHAVYLCEGSFERMFAGAIFGPILSGTVYGWKSELDSREECVDALDYFLGEASRARAEFGQGLRMADVPLASTPLVTPATLALQARRPDVFRLLLKHGADVHTVSTDMLDTMEVLTELREYRALGNEEQADECLSLGKELHPGGQGWPLLSLKGLARIALRKQLAKDHILPDRLPQVAIPGSLVPYIRLGL